MPAHPFPASSDHLLESSLDDLAGLIRDYELGGLSNGLDWLVRQQPAPPSQGPRILHLDFHPLNLIERAHDSPVVLDWDLSDVGDPHADVATTIMLLDTAINPGTNAWERTLVWGGRQLLSKLYLSAYQKWLPLDEAKLTYYRAWAVLRRLGRYGRWFSAGPQVTGAKASLLTQIRPTQIKRMCRYFRKLTAIDVRI